MDTDRALKDVAVKMAGANVKELVDRGELAERMVILLSMSSKLRSALRRVRLKLVLGTTQLLASWKLQTINDNITVLSHAASATTTSTRRSIIVS